MKRMVVIPGDPLYKYHQKGEVKSRYWNPGSIFDEVHIISLCEQDIEPEQVQSLVGEAKLYIHSIGRPNFANLLFYFSKVCRLIKRLEPDIIRAHGPWHCGSLGVYAGKRLGIPCVVSIHNDIDVVRRYERPVLLNLVRPLERYSLSQASAVICVSNYLHRYAQNHGARRTITNYNRVYCEQFEGEREYDRGKELTILSVMRLDSQKDPQTIIRAVAPLSAKLILIGRGEMELELQNLVSQLGMEERVEFIPTVPNHQIHEYYLQADIFAMSTHYEGFCIPVLEAMAAGLPVVSCPTEPIPEILGRSGLIVDRTPDDFTRAFSDLIEDAELRRHLGEKARERASQFEGKRMEDREKVIYQAFMSGDEADVKALFTDEFRFIKVDDEGP